MCGLAKKKKKKPDDISLKLCKREFNSHVRSWNRWLRFKSSTIFDHCAHFSVNCVTCPMNQVRLPCNCKLLVIVCWITEVCLQRHRSSCCQDETMIYNTLCGRLNAVHGAACLKCISSLICDYAWLSCSSLSTAADMHTHTLDSNSEPLYTVIYMVRAVRHQSAHVVTGVTGCQWKWNRHVIADPQTQCYWHQTAFK